MVLFAIGIFGAYSALDYGLWEAGGPGAGLLPGLASGGLCLFAAIALFEQQLSSEPAQLSRLAGYVAGLIGFALLMGPLGAAPAIVVLFSWTLGVVERWNWRRFAPVAAGAALFAWVLFDRLLQVPLPRGILG